MCIGHFLKSSSILRESPATMCFKKNQKDFLSCGRLVERRLVALWMRFCICGQVSFKKFPGVFNILQAQSRRKEKHSETLGIDHEKLCLNFNLKRQKSTLKLPVLVGIMMGTYSSDTIFRCIPKLSTSLYLSIQLINCLLTV